MSFGAYPKHDVEAALARQDVIKRDGIERPAGELQQRVVAVLGMGNCDAVDAQRLCEQARQPRVIVDI